MKQKLLIQSGHTQGNFVNVLIKIEINFKLKFGVGSPLTGKSHLMLISNMGNGFKKPWI